MASLAEMIRAEMVAAGANGSNLVNFANGIADAVLLHIYQSLTFTTVDVGNLGVGTGSGVGILTLDPVTMATEMASTWAAAGPNAMVTAQAISNAVVSYLTTRAALISEHPTIGNGTGTIAPGGFSGLNVPVFTALMVESFVAQGASASAPNLVTFCNGITTAVTNAIQMTGTGTVVIVGPGSTGGTGTGTGTVDPY